MLGGSLANKKKQTFATLKIWALQVLALFVTHAHGDTGCSYFFGFEEILGFGFGLEVILDVKILLQFVKNITKKRDNH